MDNPEALLARGIAWGLHQRGHAVRMLEERRNPALRHTLETVGADASRQAYDNFQGILIHSFEPRSGAQLMEWVARELSLVDLAIAIDGLPVELTRWIANLDHEALARAFVSYRPETLDAERAAELELERFDFILATAPPKTNLAWNEIAPVLAPQDRESIARTHLPDFALRADYTPDEVAAEFERLVGMVRSREG